MKWWDQKVNQIGKGIIITGKGYPDVRTRVLVKHLSQIQLTVDVEFKVDDENLILFDQEPVEQLSFQQEPVDHLLFEQEAPDVQFEEAIDSIHDQVNTQQVHVNVLQKNLPILILTDCDAHGIDIALTYKIGSRVSFSGNEGNGI